MLFLSHNAAVLCYRKAKDKYVIDFENLPELPAGIFDLAANKDISLKSVVPVSNMLPPDHHYKVSLTTGCPSSAEMLLFICLTERLLFPEAKHGGSGTPQQQHKRTAMRSKLPQQD